MGALEALNGMILFGLTTAFLYGMIRELLSQQSAKSRLSRSQCGKAATGRARRGTPLCFGLSALMIGIRKPS
jgi:hypothetical protein